MIVKGRNLVSTLADRSGAGRVETLTSKDSKDARVAAGPNKMVWAVEFYKPNYSVIYFRQLSILLTRNVR